MLFVAFFNAKQISIIFEWIMVSQGNHYAEFVGWANQFETASLEVQRMIVNKMVKEISIGKGIDGEYEVKILLRGTYNQFINPEYAVAWQKRVIQYIMNSRYQRKEELDSFNMDRPP